MVKVLKFFGYVDFVNKGNFKNEVVEWSFEANLTVDCIIDLVEPVKDV